MVIDISKKPNMCLYAKSRPNNLWSWPLLLDIKYGVECNLFTDHSHQSLNRHQDEVAEWLRRWTANPMCSARVGSNPILVELFLLHAKFRRIAYSSTLTKISLISFKYIILETDYIYILESDISMFSSIRKVILVVWSLCATNVYETGQNDVSHDSIKFGPRYLHLNVNIQLRTS